MKKPFEIAPSDPTHGKALSRLMRMFKSSRERLAKRRGKWTEAENLFRAYAPEKSPKKGTSTSTFQEIFLPYSYALALTAHTYASGVFMNRSPLWQFKGRHGETEQHTQALEALMDYNQVVGGMAPVQFVWLLDALKYGVGVVASEWEDRKEVFSRYELQRKDLNGVVFGEPKWELVEEILDGYCGNKISNVRPYDFYPDPRVSLVNFQDGEFCGRTLLGNKAQLKSLEESQLFFNLDMLGSDTMGAENMTPDTSGSPDNLLAASDVWAIDDLKSGGLGLFNVTVRLVPKEWGLADSERPQLWQFTVANNRLIIQSKPLGLAHCKFPIDVIAFETDGYDVSTRGMMELTEPLNKIMNWLFNSHLFSVRQTLNGNLVVDPTKINIKDLMDTGPGKIIRTLPGAMGSDIRSAFAEIQTLDPTRGHLSNVPFVENVMQRVTGASDPIGGMPRSGGRRTATEIRTTSSASANRLKTFCDYASAVGWTPLALKLVSNLQQNYKTEKLFRIAGDLIQASKFVQVTPQMIAGSYDYVPVDGTLPIDRFAQATLWKEIFMVVGKVPQIAQGYDIASIFAHMARLAGLVNINQFRVLPDQQLMQQAQAGNAVPVAGGNPGYAGDSPSAAIGSMVGGITGGIGGS